MNFDLILLIWVFSLFLVILAKGLISILIIYLLWTNSLWYWALFVSSSLIFFPWLLFHVTYLILVCLAIFLVHNEIIWDIIYIYCKFLYLGNLLVDLPWMDPKLFISCTCLFFSFLEILSFFTDSFNNRLL